MLVNASNLGDSPYFLRKPPRPYPSKALLAEMEKRLSHPNRQCAARIELEEDIAAMREQLCRDVERFIFVVLGEIASKELMIQSLLKNSIDLLEAGTDSVIVSLDIVNLGYFALDDSEAPMVESNSNFVQFDSESDSELDSSSTSWTDGQSSAVNSDSDDSTVDDDSVIFSLDVQNSGCFDSDDSEASGYFTVDDSTSTDYDWFWLWYRAFDEHET